MQLFECFIKVPLKCFAELPKNSKKEAKTCGNTAGLLMGLRLGQLLPVRPGAAAAPWERPPRWYFPFLLTLTAGLALSLLAASLAQALLPLPRGAAPAVTAGVAVLLTLYWAVPAHSGACCVPRPLLGAFGAPSRAVPGLFLPWSCSRPKKNVIFIIS